MAVEFREQKIEWNEDHQIKNRPMCGVSGCNNEGWIHCGGSFLCGDHAAKYNKAQQKFIMSMMEN